MIEELRIDNFAIIDDLDITFKPGMNVLLGETGAGKSIIIDALGLISGKRAEFDKLKDESKKAFVEASFDLDDGFISNHPYLKDYLDGNRLVVSRSLLPSKSALARINGETVSLNALKKVMDGLIDIHSQGDSSLLLDEENYLVLIDKSSDKCLAALEKYKKTYAELKKALDEKEAFIKTNDISQKDFLSYQKDEIEKFKLKPNEIEDLSSELKSMESYEDLENKFKDLSSFCYQQEEGSQVFDILDGLSSRLRGLEDGLLSKESEEALKESEGLSSSLHEIFDKFEELDFSPEKIDQINQRLFELTDLQRKYGKTTSDILSAYDNICSKLKGMETFNDDLKAMEDKIKGLEEETDKAGNELTSRRNEASKTLEKKVNEELLSLGLKSGGFKIEMTKSDRSSSGYDKASFMISMNVGTRFMKMKEAISGGENSRLCLALKAVFNKLSPYSTMVFDEIDSGISGQIAFKAAKKMKEISKDSQVIVISHLPQVVAASEHHFLVYKDVKDKMTSSHIASIEGQRVVEEIAKMISGDKPSESALAAAKELIGQFTK